MLTWHVVPAASVGRDWCWIERENAHRGWRYRYYDACEEALAHASRDSSAVMVTHDCPSARTLASLPTPGGRVRPTHLAFSFHVPRPLDTQERAAWHQLAPKIDMFACHSSYECAHYAAELAVPRDRFTCVPWYFETVTVARTPVVPGGPYLCAAGGSMRDYRTLFAAMGQLPELRLVAVVRPESLHGLSVPQNVSIMCDIPQTTLWNVLAHSTAHVLSMPANSRSGHSLLTQGMYLGVPTIVSDVPCVQEYVHPGRTTVTVPAGDAGALVRAVRSLQADRDGAQRLATAAQAFARAELSKQRMGDRLEALVSRLRGDDRAPSGHHAA